MPLSYVKMPFDIITFDLDLEGSRQSP